MKYITLSDGSVLFRSVPPAGFVFKNYAPVPGNPQQYRAIYAFECEYRKITEVCSPCGKQLLGHDTKCSLDGEGTSFSQCNACDPEDKRANMIILGLLKAYPVGKREIEQQQSDVVPDSISVSLSPTVQANLGTSILDVLNKVNNGREDSKRSTEVEPTSVVGFNQEAGCSLRKSESLLGEGTTDSL